MHVLHVVEIVEQIHELHQPFDLGDVGDLNGGGREHGEIGRLNRNTGLVERLTNLREVRWRGGDPPHLSLVDDVFGARIEGGEHNLVLLDRRRHEDDALAFELPRHGAGLGQRATVLRQGRADVAGCAVAVVGEALDQQRNPTRRVALVGDRLIVDAFELARTALDGTLDRVERHRVVAGLLKHGAQCRVGVGIAAALTGRNLDLLDQLGEELAALRVGRTLLVLDRRPLGMTAHGVTSTVSSLASARPSGRSPASINQRRCSRESPDSSG